MRDRTAMSHLRRVPRVVLGAASLVAAAAFAASLAEAQDARLAQRLDSATAFTVNALVDSARASGLPGEPLVQMALQGAARGAPGARVVLAVRALRLDLDAARSALGVAADAELVAGAAAVRAGIPAAVLTRLRALRPGRSLIVPLAALADLRVQGRTVAEASGSVLGLASRGASDDEFVALGRSIEMGRRDAPPPLIAAPGVAGAPGGAPALVPRGPTAAPPGRPVPPPPATPGGSAPPRP